jgi:hypothetical protein
MKPNLTTVFKMAAVSIPLITAGSLFAAGPLDFDFSFTNTIGDVSGTVSGEIIGLTDNSTGSASEVVIDSFPSGLDSIFGSNPIATSWDQQDENTFTVSGGQVVAGGFWAQQTVNNFQQGAQLYVDGDGGPYNFLNLDGTDGLYVWGNDGFAAANIVPAGPSVPDAGATLPLMVVALLGVGTFARKFRQLTA